MSSMVLTMPHESDQECGTSLCNTSSSDNNYQEARARAPYREHTRVFIRNTN